MLHPVNISAEVKVVNGHSHAGSMLSDEVAAIIASSTTELASSACLVSSLEPGTGQHKAHQFCPAMLLVAVIWVQYLQDMCM